MNRLRALLSKWDAVAPRKLLLANLAISVFIRLAHGGALLAISAKPTPGVDADAIRALATFSLPLAALVAVSALLGLVRSQLVLGVLALQGFVLGVGAVTEIAWGVQLLINGIPDGNFSWSVGLFTASVCYAAFLVSRFSVPARFKSQPPAFFAPLVAVAIAAPIDVGVLIKTMETVAQHVGV